MEKVLDWSPEQTFYDDNSQLNTIRHVHAVVTDPYTGHVWVATGDVNQHSRLYFSDNSGQNFDLVALGSQRFRSLSIWFTEGYRLLEDGQRACKPKCISSTTDFI